MIPYAGADRNRSNYLAENRAASTHVGWSDERIELLRDLADKKLSATEIARELGAGATRNTVIGKATRLGIKIDSGARGLARRAPCRTPSRAPFPGVQVNGSGIHASDCRASEGRASGHTTRRSGEVGTAAAVERSAAALKPAIDFFDAPVARPLTIHELCDEHCRWPLGEPYDLDTFRYCGARVDLPGIVPYCAGHTRLAYARAA